MALARQNHADALDDLLIEGRAYSAEFPYLLANHLPMILVALDRLGAPEARLRSYFDMYRCTKGLVPVPPAGAPIAAGTWADALGDRSREADYRNFFVLEVRRLGIETSLRAYLPTLIPGIAASALHGLMRLSYAVARMDAAEVGTALGYWAATYLPLPPSTGAAPITDDPGVVLARIGSLADMHRIVPETDLLWHTIREAVGKPDFAPVVDWLAIGPDTQQHLAATSLALFAGTMDFSALHALTGTHWIRMLAPVVPDIGSIQRHFWQTIASLVPKIGFPALPTTDQLDYWRQLPAPEWPDIAVAAIASDDEHDISLTFSAREEEKVYGDRLYRVVAARRVGLID